MKLLGSVQTAHTLMRENSGLCWLGGLGYGYLALFTFSHFYSACCSTVTAVNISANGFGYAICQVCNNVFVLLNMTCYNNSLV